MKVLLNVQRVALDPLGPDWVECQGFRLVEVPDGSFDLIVTTDIEASRAAASDAIADAKRRWR